MNKYLKLTAPLLAVACIALFWSKDDNRNNTKLRMEVSEKESPNYSKGKDFLLDEDKMIAKERTESSLLPTNTIHEQVIFSSTEEYEANSRYGKLPSHMSDIAIERFSINQDRQLVINENIKNIFEYFLTASHVEGREQAAARIVEYIELSLEGEAASQALKLANNYLAYKDNLHTNQFAMSTDFSQEENLNMLRSALDNKKQTRREYLGETASNALFGHEERYDDFSYQRLVINSDKSLSDDDKDRLMAKAEDQLPTEMAADMRYKREELKLNSKINDLKQGVDNEEEIFELRSSFYGEKVAKRLKYLESNTPEWQARVSEFYQIRNDILASNKLSDSEKREAIKQAKHNAFTHKEQIKLAVQSIRGA